MKILIWSQYFWPENFLINELSAALQRNFMQITVLTGKPNYPDGKVFSGYSAGGLMHENYHGVEVVRVPLVARGKDSLLRLVLNYLSFILSGYVFGPFALRRHKFDVVFVYAPSPLLQALPAVLLARLKRAPLVVWVQDLWPESLIATGFIKNRLMIKVVETLVRHIYRRSDSILIQSEAFRGPVTRLGGDPQIVRYYPNTAHPSQDETEIVVDFKLLSQLRTCFSVVFSGNLGTAQSLETILCAAENLKSEQEIQFYLIGTGSRSTWLAQEVDRRKLTNVVLTGRLPQSQMPSVFAASSALLVTLGDSPALALTIPSKLQAYLAAGKPVIASLNGEGARIVREAKAGFVSPSGDAKALASAVLKLYRLAPCERDCMGSNGRSYFEEHFEPSKRLDELIELLQRLSKMEKGKGQ